MSFKEIYITMSKKNYSRSKLEGWRPEIGKEHLYEELWFYGKSFWYRKGTEKHKQAKIKYDKYQNTRGNNYSTKGKNNYKSGKTYFT
jgi:hypothetical protein